MMTIVVIFIIILLLNCVLYAILNTPYSVPTAHCSDAKIKVKNDELPIGNC